MRILISGATGLVGSAIVELCHRKKIAVSYLTTNKDSIEKKENYTGYHWDPDKLQVNPECFEGVSAIINLAGSSISKRWTKRQKRIILSSRINSLRTLAKGLKETKDHRISTMVSASAIGIYPDSLSEYYTEEEQRVDSSFLGEVVASWEKETDTFKEFKLAVAKVRIGLVLSTDGGALPEMARPVKNFVGAPLGSGDQWQSWIHIDDLARLFLFITRHKLEGVYNAVAPNPVTNSKLVREIAAELEKPLILPNIPEIALKLILGEMATLLISSQRVSSKKIENAGFDFHHPNISRALQDLYETGKNDPGDLTG